MKRVVVAETRRVVCPVQTDACMYVLLGRELATCNAYTPAAEYES
jgi:hypothetical protein